MKTASLLSSEGNSCFVTVMANEKGRTNRGLRKVCESALFCDHEPNPGDLLVLSVCDKEGVFLCQILMLAMIVNFCFFPDNVSLR